MGKSRNDNVACLVELSDLIIFIMLVESTNAQAFSLGSLIGFYTSRGI